MLRQSVVFVVFRMDTQTFEDVDIVDRVDSRNSGGIPMIVEELMLPIVAIAVTLMAFCLGGRVRALVNVIIPLKDPITWMIFVAVASMFILPAVTECPWEIDNVFLVASVIGFIPSYIYGYSRTGIDKEYVAVHNIIDIRQGEVARPLVIYYNKEGQQCFQPQNMCGILKRLIFGVHNPLELNRGMVKRHRTIDLMGDYLRIRVQAIDAVEVQSTPITVNRVRIGSYKANRNGVVRSGHKAGEPRYLFHFSAESRKYTISPTETNEPMDYYINGAIADHVMRNYEGILVKSMDNEIKLRTQGVEQGAKILSHQADLKPGSHLFRALLGDIRTDKDMKSNIEKMKRSEEDENNG